MEFTPVSSALGVRVRDLDLDAGCSERELAELQRALDEHHLLLFRGAPIGLDAQMDLCQRLGAPIDEQQDGKNWFTITNRKPGGGRGRLLFHSDFAFSGMTLTGISLYAVEVPDAGGATAFVNAVRAWATLPDELRARVEGRDASHVFRALLGGYGATARTAEAHADDLSTTHPVKRLHPRTGAPILYLSELFGERIEGCSREESDELIDALFAHLYRGEHIYEHHWQPNDLVLWDNVALQHARLEDAEGPRTNRRIAFTATPAETEELNAWLAARAAAKLKVPAV